MKGYFRRRKLARDGGELKRITSDASMKPTFFRTPDDFRKWLEKNHAAKNELLIGFYKKDSGKPSITWTESVDEALCYGWIDGVRKSLNQISYTIRFTPPPRKHVEQCQHQAGRSTD